jgi:hypothetical protein
MPHRRWKEESAQPSDEAEFLDLVVCNGTIVGLWLDDRFFKWGLFPYLCFLT